VRALILMADTGGGHRAVSRALADSLKRQHTEGIAVSIVDPLARTRRGLVRQIADLYGPAQKYGRAIYHAAFRLTDSVDTFARVREVLGGPLIDTIEEILTAEDPDVVVFAHSLVISPGLDAIGRRAQAGARPVRGVTMVTDLATIHASWYDPRVALYFAPTDPVARTLRGFGVADERITVTGLPVNPRFGSVDTDVRTLRTALWLVADAPTALLMTGGDGSGPVIPLVTSLSRALPELQIVVVCGRNERLKRTLDGFCLPPLVRILGFVDNVPELMHAADFVISKGGPQSICEALASHRPVIVTDLLPGQEAGNAAYVVRNGAGFYAPTTGDVLSATRRLLWDDALCARLSAAAAAASFRGTADRVASIIASQAVAA